MASSGTCRELCTSELFIHSANGFGILVPLILCTVAAGLHQNVLDRSIEVVHNPGPGTYNHTSSVGTVAESTKRTSSRAVIGTQKREERPEVTTLGEASIQICFWMKEPFGSWIMSLTSLLHPLLYRACASRAW